MSDFKCKRCGRGMFFDGYHSKCADEHIKELEAALERVFVQVYKARANMGSVSSRCAAIEHIMTMFDTEGQYIFPTDTRSDDDG